MLPRVTSISRGLPRANSCSLFQISCKVDTLLCSRSHSYPRISSVGGAVSGHLQHPYSCVIACFFLGLSIDQARYTFAYRRSYSSTRLNPDVRSKWTVLTSFVGLHFMRSLPWLYSINVQADVFSVLFSCRIRSVSRVYTWFDQLCRIVLGQRLSRLGFTWEPCYVWALKCTIT